MCGNLRHSHWTNKAPVNPGQPIPAGGVYSTQGSVLHPSTFNGHARSEKLNEWKEKGWEEVQVTVESFTEGGKTQVPEGNLRAVAKKLGGSWRVNILTRESTPEERKTHPRWPLTTKG